MADDEKSLHKKRKNGVQLIMEDPRYVLFDNLENIRAFTEYVQCGITDIQRAITQDRC